MSGRCHERVTVYYQNVRGLRTKSNIFSAGVNSDNYDIYCLTETWLQANIPSSEYFGSNFSVYRHDRHVVTSGKRFEGGVMTGCKQRFCFLQKRRPRGLR